MLTVCLTVGLCPVHLGSAESRGWVRLSGSDLLWPDCQIPWAWVGYESEVSLMTVLLNSDPGLCVHPLRSLTLLNWG